MVDGKRVLSRLTLLLVLALPTWAQYWQQHVEYDMDVCLDATAKTLTVNSHLSYVNHSPDSLDRIYMHLIPNAFNTGTLAYEVWTWYGDEFDTTKGWTGISIDVIGTDVSTYNYEIRDDTILDIELPSILLPGDTLNFSFDWHSNIHPHIDRSGWEDDRFDIAQWYPKFVVYDEQGWHDDPFGDWGEFYGEFGDFTVRFDLPATHVIAATGVVVEGNPGWSAVQVDTSQDWDTWIAGFLPKRAEQLAALPDSARRQVVFFAENVHDFAWVCSPDYLYEHQEWNGIDVNVLFTAEEGEKWTRDVAAHGRSAIQWLSENFGPYPWPQISIVQAMLGGGMEYPMLIMNGYESESLIVHEIGHNWFYGLFGNDELDDAWLDEGFTTFQTRWYQEVKYPRNGYDITRDNITRFENEHLLRQMYLEAGYKTLLTYMASPENEPLATRSYDFKGYRSYRENVYTKGSYMLHSLKNYLGEERFKAGMRLYYDRWSLKHVNELRFVKAMEDASGEELDWFFDQWLHTTKLVDYGLGKITVQDLGETGYRSSINVENLGGFFVPIPVTVYSAEGDSVTTHLKNFKHHSQGVIEITTRFKPVRYYLDADNVFLDVDRRNNDSMKKRAWRYDYTGWDAYPDDRALYLWKPEFSYNDMAGLGLGLNLKRVYRNPGDHTTLALDYNLKSGGVDLLTSFRKQQRGLPIAAVWFGSARQWRGTVYADLAYELNWNQVYQDDPLHYLTLKADFSEAVLGAAGFDPADSYTRLGFQYEMQHDLLGGDQGLSVQFLLAPADLNIQSRDFSQASLMHSWDRQFGQVRLNNRTNLLLNSKDTPNMLLSRLASADLRSAALDRLATSLYNIDAVSSLGSAYYLAGGGRMRGYADSLDVPVNYIWSNNVEVQFPRRIMGAHRLEIHGFFDMGQYSQNGSDWTAISDFGFGIAFIPNWERNNWVSTFLRPVRIRVEFPLGRLIDGEFTGAGLADAWLFSISK